MRAIFIIASNVNGALSAKEADTQSAPTRSALNAELRMTLILFGGCYNRLDCMAKRKVEDELVQLSALRTSVPPEAAIAPLKKALRDPINVIAARAAKVSAELNLKPLIPDMLAAFDRLLRDPVKSDPQCWGKNAVSKALKDLGHADSAVFVRGLRHIQMEPVWNGREETAAVLRASCALALGQCNDIPLQAMHTCLVDAMGDQAAVVRVDAARALAELGTPEAILLLRLKARVGDKESSVTGEVLGFLLHLEENHAVDFAGSFLNHPDEAVREEAALALGSSRLEAAITFLRERWPTRASGDLADALIRALGVSRLDSAIQFLIEIVRGAPSREALSALQMLAAHRDSPKVMDKLAEAVNSRRENEIHAYFRGHLLG